MCTRHVTDGSVLVDCWCLCCILCLGLWRNIRKTPLWLSLSAVSRLSWCVLSWTLTVKKYKDHRFSALVQLCSSAACASAEFNKLSRIWVKTVFSVCGGQASGMVSLSSTPSCCLAWISCLHPAPAFCQWFIVDLSHRKYLAVFSVCCYIVSAVCLKPGAWDSIWTIRIGLVNCLQGLVVVSFRGQDGGSTCIPWSVSAVW